MFSRQLRMRVDALERHVKQLEAKLSTAERQLEQHANATLDARMDELDAALSKYIRNARSELGRIWKRFDEPEPEARSDANAVHPDLPQPETREQLRARVRAASVGGSQHHG